MVEELTFPVVTSAAHEQSGISGNVPQFSFDDLVVGTRLLGSGAFCRVYAACLLSECDSLDYAIKILRSRSDEKTDRGFETASEDLKNEASLLSTLSHQNIITLKGISRMDEPGRLPFLLLDRLVDTLSSRIRQWREQGRRTFGNTKKKTNGLKERLHDVAIGVANALEYLHKQGIVHRDIKPCNIGFDQYDDRPVLFDFGLARRFQTMVPTRIKEVLQSFNESTVSLSSPDDSISLSEATSCSEYASTHEMSGATATFTDNTGPAGTPRYESVTVSEWANHFTAAAANTSLSSFRYMAPEIARYEQYGASADVYSFAILLWELATLKIPFGKHKTLKAIKLRVVDGRERPSTRNIASKKLQSLLKCCWSDCPEKRPPATWVRIKLEEIVGEPAAQLQPRRCSFMVKERSSLQVIPRRPRTERRRSCPNF